MIKLPALVLASASTASAFNLGSTLGLQTTGRAQWHTARAPRGRHPGSELGSEPGPDGFGGDVSADDWFDRALAGADDADGAFGDNFFDNPDGGFDGGFDAADGPAKSADDWFDMALGGADADPFEAAAAAAAAAEWAALEADASGQQPTNAEWAVEAHEVTDDDYARMMGADHTDAADTAVWGAEANAIWAGQATDGRGLRLPTVGIDLGTTNSLCAIWLKGRPTLVPNDENSHLTPSVVSYLEDGRKREGYSVTVGRKAKGQALSNPANTFASVKRILGRPASGEAPFALTGLGDQVQAAMQPNGEFMLRVPAISDDSMLSPVDISAQVVNQLVANAAHLFGGAWQTPPRAVVGVPARFNKYQRAATIEACKQSGLQEVHLITEPEAAALAFGLGRREVGKSKAAMEAARGDRQKVERTLVVDLGGGTFDVSVVDVKADRVETVAVGGDPLLGGVDFDDALALHLANLFYDASGGLRVGPFESATGVSWNRLLAAAELCRIELSTSTEATVHLPNLLDGLALGPVQVTRKEFEKAASALVARVEEGIVSTLMNAATFDQERDTPVENQSLNNAVLVGGAVRMPFIGRLVKACTGVVPRRTVNPDEAIALGCAVEGAYLDGMVNDLRLIKASPNRKLTVSEEKGNAAHIMARASLEKAGRC